MKPVTFACQQRLPLAPKEVAEQILDVAKWPDFRGYRPISGIKSAEFETRTPTIVGSRIRVTNLDGSTHVEEVVVWQPGKRPKKPFLPGVIVLGRCFPVSGLSSGEVTYERSGSGVGCTD